MREKRACYMVGFCRGKVEESGHAIDDDLLRSRLNGGLKKGQGYDK